MTITATIDSPIGPLGLTAHDDGTLTSLQLDAPGSIAPAPAALRSVTQQLEAYFDGQLTEFDVRLDLQGTPFQHQVWAALLEIPYGETTSYGEIAREIGTPTGSRAVGLANARNPVAIIVPCHRVVGADGTLTGYAYGLDRKRHLLDLEHKVRFSAV